MAGSTKPWLWIACALVSAGLLAGSMFSHRWLVSESNPEDGFSPRSMQLCKTQGADCRVGSVDSAVAAIDDSVGGSAPHTSPLFVPTGTLAYYAAFLAFAALLVSAFLAMGKPSEFPVSPTTFATLAIVVGGIGGVLFVAMPPVTSPFGGGPFKTGWGAVIFAFGTLGGLVASRKLAPYLKPVKTKVVAVESTKAGRRLARQSEPMKPGHKTGAAKKKQQQKR